MDNEGEEIAGKDAGVAPEVPGAEMEVDNGGGESKGGDTEVLPEALDVVVDEGADIEGEVKTKGGGKGEG